MTRVLVLTLLLAVACGGRAAPMDGAHVVGVPGAASAEASHGRASEPALAAATGREAGGPIPIYAEDTRWGSDNAPVTMVAFMDLQCPFCAKAAVTLAALKENFGPAALRIVIKHYPLPFHPFAREASLSAIVVQHARGDEASLAFIAKVLEHQADLSRDRIAQWKHELIRPVSPPVGRRPQTRPARVIDARFSPEEQLARDEALVKKIDVMGTPCFFINGIRLSGAQPYERFSELVESELQAVKDRARKGLPAGYADRVAKNFPPEAAPAAKAAPPPEEDDQVWKVPVGTSPTLGPPDALVTIIEFSDYQCPFCERVQETLRDVRNLYGKDVRIVFKHNPLPFHERARPAAQFAVEAYRQQGAAGFWKATEALFEAPAAGFNDQELRELGKRLGLDAKRVARALEKNLHDNVIQADSELAMDFQARGTPHFFINGKRLAGAHTLEKFVALIDEQLEAAKRLVNAGTPRARVYATILRTAKGPPPPDVLDLGVPPDDRPSRGPSRAPVVIRMFSDLQCPFCERAQETVRALQKEFPREVRLVFHNLPLDFHDRARAAANAALEARAQGGDAAFWKMHDLIFEHRDDLSDTKLAEHALALGLNPGEVVAAVRSGRYDPIIDEDAALAQRAGIRGTPAFSVNGYFISGAQRIEIFRKLVRRALEDRRRGIRPTPNFPKAPSPSP